MVIARASRVTSQPLLRAVLACSLAWLLTPQVAGAQLGTGETVGNAERYRLRWVREHGAETCVSGAVLARLLAQVVEPRATAGSEPQLVLDGRIEMADEPLHFRAVIAVHNATSGEPLGERELTSADAKCSAFTPAVLLVLAMSVDPEAARGGLPSAVTEELRRGQDEDVDVWPAPSAVAATLASPLVQPAPRRDSVVARSTTPVSLERTVKARPTLHAALTLSAQVQPQLSPGVLLGGMVPVSGDWLLSLAALGWWPRRVPVATSPYTLDDSVEFNAGQVVVEVCRRLRGSGELRFRACAGGELGLRWLSAPAFTNRNNPYRAFFGPELGFATEYGLGAQWLIDLRVNGMASLRPDRFSYRDHAGNERLLFEPEVVSGRVLLGIGRQL